MAQGENFLRQEELGGFDFGDKAPVAPAGFNPDQIGRMSPPPVGDHEMEVIDFAITDAPSSFRWDGQTYYHHKLQVFLQVCSGPHKGTGVADYLPMPSTHCPFTSVGLANRWGQFLKSLGFALPEGKCVPDGFKLNQIKGRKCVVSCKHNEDDTGAPKYKEGAPDIGVRLFGYRPVGSVATGLTGKAATAAATRQSAARHQPAAPSGAPAQQPSAKPGDGSVYDL